MFDAKSLMSALRVHEVTRYWEGFNSLMKLTATLLHRCLCSTEQSVSHKGFHTHQLNPLATART
jgi:hypothetical protein